MTILGNGDGIRFTAFGRRIEITRRLGQYGSGQGPTIVAIAGLHGNEPAGVVAVKELLAQLEHFQPNCPGRVIGLAGNLAALQRGVRYIDSDLNRLWRPEFLQNRDHSNGNQHLQHDCSEDRELRELYSQIQHILKTETPPFYFIDLHTTSSLSPPFIPFDDTLSNRRFVQRFPVPGILGIEEYVRGTLLSYLVRYKVVTLGYEAGQHDDPRSVDYHHAMLVMAMMNAGILNRDALPNARNCEKLLKDGCRDTRGFYEIRYRYAIEPDEQFQMLPGFESFHPVRKRQRVATNRHGSVSMPENGQIFMPLYQSQGDDGFFVIRRVPRFWLEMSTNFRRWRLERFIARLPGVRPMDEHAVTLSVNPRIARFLSRQLFHLLGYRRTDSSDSYIQFTRRDG